jgi:hypothetical protein
LAPATYERWSPLPDYEWQPSAEDLLAQSSRPIQEIWDSASSYFYYGETSMNAIKQPDGKGILIQDKGNSLYEGWFKNGAYSG